MATENGQPAEEETGLDVDLGKVFDEVNKEEPEAKPAEKPKEEPKPEETQAEEEKPAPEEPKVEEPPVTEEAVEEPEKEEIVPPATWTADAKEKFSDMDPVLQQEVLKREKDFAQGVQKYADQAKEAESYESAIAPYKAIIQSTGASPQQAFANYLNVEYQLRTATPQQRGQMILQIANQYGADLSQLNPSEEDDYTDPEIKALNEKIASLENKTQSQIDQAKNQQLQTLQQQINDFKADPANKHFDKVQNVMSALMTNGSASSLKEAYDQSLRLVPEVFDEIVSNKVKEVETARIKQDTDAAAKAKKAAGVQLTNEEAGVVPVKEGTMEEDLGAAFDKAQAS